MRRILCVGVILLLAGLAAPSQAMGQQQDPPDRDSGFRLGQNYPNPFNPETRIPFELGESLFENEQPVRVTLRIYNVLQQLVAVPTALNHPLGNGVPVENLEYDTPGPKEAFWDGRDLEGRQVASGIYYMQLIVNGESVVRRMIVAK
ncbi:MAG TPA: hypothetical protein VF039_06235 [Longimicrobiales bacterium]